MSAPEVQPDPNSLVGTTVAERYFVEQLLGEGAMGRVYRARHVHMQKHVALKVLHRQTSENAELVTRFEREAVAAGRISHPNVAQATDFGRLSDGSFYLVLEYVSGRSLGHLLEAEGALAVPRALRIARQIFDALSAAHRADIVHRDLKPDNVMLISSGDAPPAMWTPDVGESTDVVKVLDFGLAKLQSADAMDTQLTQAGAIYGTPQYMSPEQAAGGQVDARADLYAAGVIFYEMLAGKPPFEAEQLMPLLLKHMTEAPPPLPESIPRQIRQVVFRLLEKKPEQRFASAEEVLAALDALLTDSRAVEKSEAHLTSLGPGGLRRAREGAVGRLIGPVVERGIEFLKRPVQVGQFRFRMWLPVLALGLGVGAALLLRSPSDLKPMAREVQPQADTSSPPPVEAPAKAASSGVDAELMKVIDAAKLGSDPALYALEHRADGERSDVEWMALVQAYLMRRDVDKALTAYDHALEKNATHGSDMAMLGALRYLVDDEKVAQPILEFVARRLPDVAADFLFDVWSRTSAKTKATEEAKELLDSSGVKSHYSEALGLAFAIREAPNCSTQIGLLPKLILRGDERALPRLREMKRDAECGKLAGKNLDEAVTQVSLRKAPRFPLLRRWRWKTAGSTSAPGETVEDKPEKKKKFILF